jgi:hypothetical protein
VYLCSCWSFEHAWQGGTEGLSEGDLLARVTNAHSELNSKGFDVWHVRSKIGYSAWAAILKRPLCAFMSLLILLAEV